jgi:hypothetical protein
VAVIPGTACKDSQGRSLLAVPAFKLVAAKGTYSIGGVQAAAIVDIVTVLDAREPISIAGPPALPLRCFRNVQVAILAQERKTKHNFAGFSNLPCIVSRNLTPEVLRAKGLDWLTDSLFDKMASDAPPEEWEIAFGNAVISALDRSTFGDSDASGQTVGSVLHQGYAEQLAELLLGTFERQEQAHFSEKVRKVTDDFEEYDNKKGNNSVPCFSQIPKDIGSGEHQHVQGVLNLLLYGWKIWRLHGPQDPGPAHPSRLDKTFKPVFVYVIQMPGDLLYIPPGWYHEIWAELGRAPATLGKFITSKINMRFKRKCGKKAGVKKSTKADKWTTRPVTAQISTSWVSYFTPPHLRAEALLRHVSGQVGEAQSGQGLPANDLAFHEQIGYQPIGVPLFHRLTAANLFNSGPANNGPPPPKKMP